MRREHRGEQAERAAEHVEIGRRNGERIIAEPTIVLDAITRQHSTFTRRDLARFVSRHTADAAQFAHWDHLRTIKVLRRQTANLHASRSLDQVRP